MIKKFTTGFALMLSAFTFSQVGIQTETPQATLDVVGAPDDASKFDGIIAPRITGEQLRAKTYTGDQQGALVYVTVADTAPAGQTLDVTSAGYYYFDGTKWVITKGNDTDMSIYTADGAIAGSGITRTLTLNGNTMNFVGSQQRTSWNSLGYLSQSNLQSSTGSASMAFHGGNSSNLNIQQWFNSSASITAQGNSTQLLLATHLTTASAPIIFNTSAGASAGGTEKMRITGEGRVGISTNNPTAKLDIVGDSANPPIRARNMESSSTTALSVKTKLSPVLVDQNGVMVRQFSVVDPSDSYYFDGPNILVANGAPVDIVTGIGQGTIVKFNFLTNFAFGNSNSATIYAEVTFSQRRGFQVNENWTHSGNTSTTSLTLNGVGTSTITFGDSYGTLTISYASGKITASKTNGVNASLQILEGLKMRN